METNIVKEYNDCVRRIEFYREHKDGNMFDSFYYSHLDFMQKALEYMLEHETLIEVETEDICPHCKCKLNYKVFKDKRYAHEYGYDKDETLELRIALCSKCGEMLKIPSIEETNKEIVKPFREKEEEERCNNIGMLIPIFEDTPEPKEETENEAMIVFASPELNGNKDDDEESIECVVIPNNPNVFEVLLQSNKDTLEYSDNLANEMQTERASLYAIIKDTPEYVGGFTKFPMYMIEEMIEINPSIVIYLKESNFETILNGLEYGKKHYFSEAVEFIVNRLKEMNYNVQLVKIYGESWEKDFIEFGNCPERLTEPVKES